MSKETFEQDWGDHYDFDIVVTASNLYALIERHGGRVVWPLPAPEGQGCTCTVFHGGMASFQPGDHPQDNAGPWHQESCPLHVPF